MAFTPDEANSPLLVDAEAVLATPVATQGFETIAWRDPQIFQGFRRIQDFQLDARPMLNGWRQTPRKLTLKDPFRFTVSEAFDHS
jgi:hypothetical protein